MRTHLHLPVTAPNGDLLDYAEVTFLEGSAQVATSAALYLLDDPQASPQDQPILFAPAIIDIWCDEPHRFDLKVTGPQGFSAIIPGVDLPPAPEQSATTAVPTRIQQPPSEGRVLVSDGTSQYWAFLEVIAPHDHDGTQPGSTRLDLGLSPADAQPNQTWVGAAAGPDATVADATAASALGAQAEPLGRHVSVFGQAAATVALAGVAGDDAVALGHNASAVAQEVSLGSDAGQDVVGAVNFSLDTDGVARRYLTTEGTDLRHAVLALGTTLGSARPVPPAPAGVAKPLWLLGDGAVPGSLDVRGDLTLGQVGSTVALAGAAGTVKQPPLEVAQDAPPALASLVAALTALGLFVPLAKATVDTPLDLGLGFVAVQVQAATVDTPLDLGLDFTATSV